ncbi:MAG: biopolymer transporter ExbD [Kiritimatiellae bacterium]|nr:biopolymer transporter ExbD [Kiritimatiellia bacterium]
MKTWRDEWDQGERKVDINMSPLIDCIFLLLIFFIVTAVFVRESGVEVNRPQAVSAEELDRNSLQIALGADGMAYYDGQPLPMDRVRGLVARQLRTKKTPVIVIADADARSGRLIELIDECKLAGAEQVHVATERK